MKTADDFFNVNPVPFEYDGYLKVWLEDTLKEIQKDAVKKTLLAVRDEASVENIKYNDEFNTVRLEFLPKLEVKLINKINGD